MIFRICFKSFLIVSFLTFGIESAWSQIEVSDLTKNTADNNKNVQTNQVLKTSNPASNSALTSDQQVVTSDPKVLNTSSTPTPTPTPATNSNPQNPKSFNPNPASLSSDPKNNKSLSSPDISSLLGKKSSGISSIMFSDAELADVDRALDSFENNRLFQATDYKPEEKKEFKIEDNSRSYIYLNSILYFSPNSWSIWLNDKKISSEGNKKTAEFYVKSIDNNEVNIIWTISISKWKILSGKKSESQAPKINKNSQVEISFRLKPNQTYILSSGTVVEGRL